MTIFRVLDIKSDETPSSGQNKLKECVFVNSALKYSAILSKIHSYRLLFIRVSLSNDVLLHLYDELSHFLCPRYQIWWDYNTSQWKKQSEGVCFC